MIQREIATEVFDPMNDNRTEFQRFTDFMKAIVKVPKSEVTAQHGATRSEKPTKPVKEPKA
jgi:hypothetical protein